MGTRSSSGGFEAPTLEPFPALLLPIGAKVAVSTLSIGGEVTLANDARLNPCKSYALNEER